VSWLRNLFNREPKFETLKVDIPMTTLVRWYLYDTELVEPNELAELVGLTPVSSEGDEVEKQESELRIAQVAPLFPYLESIADISASVLTALHTKELSVHDPELSEELAPEIQSMLQVYKAVALTTLIGAFSIGMDLDLLHVTGTTTDKIIDMEEYLDGQ